MFKNLISPYIKDTSITNRFLSSFDRLTVFTTVRGKTSKISLILGFSAQSITSRVLSSFDRFTAYYNCMRKKFKILIFPFVKYTSITNRFLSSFDRFTVFTTLRGKTLKFSVIRDLSAQVSLIVFSAHLTVLRLITTVCEKFLRKVISA